MRIKNLIKGNFVERPNRFLVHFTVDSNNQNIEMAHLRDPGRLKELLIPGVQLLLRRVADNPNRKTKFDVIAVYYKCMWVLINSGFHSDLAAEIIESKFIKDIRDYLIEKREYTYGNSRIDFLLKDGNNKMLLEVKGCTLVEDGVAKFPDAPTIRGKKHLEELVASKDDEFEASVLFIIIREDADIFEPNINMDPDFTRALRIADERGVNILTYSFKTALHDNYLEIKPFKRVKINFPDI
jgi:sugar fermentation stimulation protein A